MSGGSTNGLDPTSFLDYEQAKQMAALVATNQARIASNTRITQSGGGTSSGSYLGAINHNFPQGGHDLLSSASNPHANFQMNNNFGLPQTPNSAANPAFFDSTMSQPNSNRTHAQNQHRARELNFLQQLAGSFAKRGNPLPPALTGVSVPNYDPNNTQWAPLDLGSDVGMVKIAGKDVSLFKIWLFVIQQGGAQMVAQARGWQNLATQLDLPEEWVHPMKGQISTSTIISSYYQTLLYPFEMAYKRNIQEQQKKALGGASEQGPGLPNLGRPTQGMPNTQNGMRPIGSNGMMQGSTANGLGSYQSMPGQLRPPGSTNDTLGLMDNDPFAHVDSNLLDQDIQGIKRKLDHDSGDTKRVRQKTDPPESIPMDGGSRASSQPPVNRARQQPLRRKIEYVPLARDPETHGGWDMNTIETEWHNQANRRTLRDLNDWGTVDVDCLSLSIRSRLAVELSYSLTAFTMLSTMRGPQPGSGFPLAQCPDLFDNLLDLIEEYGFGEPEKDTGSQVEREDERTFTNRELVDLVHDVEGQPFASLQPGSKQLEVGPLQRPANTIIACINIIRNLGYHDNNQAYLGKHPRLLDILLRLCEVRQRAGEAPSPVSKKLTLIDVLYLRRAVMHILLTVCSGIDLTLYSRASSSRIARRLFDLAASYLVDANDALPPLASVQIAGVAPTAALRPPALADMALEVFTKISHPDNNRQVLGRVIGQGALLRLLENLAHRLPVVDTDFVLMQGELWQSFVEKTVMGIYSIVFMANGETRQKIKTDRKLALKNIFMRIVQKVVVQTEQRGYPPVAARRAIEALKLLDKTEQACEGTETTPAVLSFGMGFTEGTDVGEEKGTGLLGGQRDLAWEVMLTGAVSQDEVLFNELESLVRVECM